MPKLISRIPSLQYLIWAGEKISHTASKAYSYSTAGQAKDIDRHLVLLFFKARQSYCLYARHTILIFSLVHLWCCRWWSMDAAIFSFGGHERVFKQDMTIEDSACASCFLLRRQLPANLRCSQSFAFPLWSPARCLVSLIRNVVMAEVRR